MKTMTCKELGGVCDAPISAETWNEAVRKMTEHVIANHPETAKEMEKMHNADPKKWSSIYKPKWDATPTEK
jgi:predicted small metal-binding protein